MPRFIKRKITPSKQDGTRATLCQLIERDDGRIFWNDSARNIFNRYRGLTPWPGIFTFWKQTSGGYIRIMFSRISASDTTTERPYGEVFETEDRIAVATSKGLIFIEEIQPEGKSAMPIRDFLNGRPDFIGSTLG